MSGKVLILGPTGRFGRTTAEAFRNAGWTVRLFDRKADTLDEAATGCDVIVNGWNPAYPEWAATVPGLTAKVIAAARASGATVILPGNVYVFGPDAPQRLTADTPHHARNPLGRIRIDMESAYRASGVQTIILRAGDFIDTKPSGNWFDMVIAKPLAKGRISFPGNPNVPHAWAYLPDMARAVVHLAEKRGELSSHEDIPFPSYTLSGNELASALSRATGRAIRLTRMSWLPVWLAYPVWKMGRLLLEMRYLWSKPHWLDGTKFHATLPDFTETPVDAALASAVQIDIDPDKAMPGRALGIDQRA